MDDWGAKKSQSARKSYIVNRKWRRGKKRQRPQFPKGRLRALIWKELLLFLFGGSGGLSGLGFHHALLEFIHAAGGVDELLRAGIKGMADVADTDEHRGFNRAGLDHVAAGAPDF